MSDAALYAAGTTTCVESWAAYAREAVGARVERLAGVAAGVFPNEPERSVYNNAVLVAASAIDAMERLYSDAGVARFAVWIHETNQALSNELEQRGYVLDTTTLAMGMSLGELALPRPELDVRELDWDQYLRAFALPGGLLAGGDHAAYSLRVAWVGDQPASTALAYYHDGDCGIYNVGTVERFRRRGLATALTASMLHEASDRGCRTASIQSTKMAEGVYAAAGFRDLGRILEYVPAQG